MEILAYFIRLLVGVVASWCLAMAVEHIRSGQPATLWVFGFAFAAVVYIELREPIRRG